MANFMCQPDWAMGCPDILLTLFLGMSVREFPEKISIWIPRLNKADCPPQLHTLLTVRVEQKGEGRENLLSLPDNLSWTSLLSCPGTGTYSIGFLVLRPSNLYYVCHQYSWFSGLFTCTRTTSLAFLGLQFADGEEDFSASKTVWGNSS